MSEKRLAVRIKPKKDSLENWKNSKIILKDGELAIGEDESGFLVYKYGNGEDLWKDLPLETDDVIHSEFISPPLDFDNLILKGDYLLDSFESLDNSPIHLISNLDKVKNIYVNVVSNNDKSKITQSLYFIYDKLGFINPSSFTRSFINSSWTEWVENGKSWFVLAEKTGTDMADDEINKLKEKLARNEEELTDLQMAMVEVFEIVVGGM